MNKRSRSLKKKITFPVLHLPLTKLGDKDGTNPQLIIVKSMVRWWNPGTPPHQIYITIYGVASPFTRNVTVVTLKQRHPVTPRPQDTKGVFSGPMSWYIAAHKRHADKHSFERDWRRENHSWTPQEWPRQGQKNIRSSEPVNRPLAYVPRQHTRSGVQQETKKQRQVKNLPYAGGWWRQREWRNSGTRPRLPSGNAKYDKLKYQINRFKNNWLTT